jgi:predicted PurR-regulated permease PerM
MSSTPLQETVNTSVEVTIRLVFLFILVAWCLGILLPFTSVVLWAIIIAVSVEPVYKAINGKIGDKPGWASFLVVMVFLVIIILPSYLTVNSLISHFKELNQSFEQGSIKIPPPNEQVAEWPIIGDELYGIWLAASQNLEKVLTTYEDQVVKLGKWLMSTTVGIGAGILQFILSIIIAGVLLATKGTDDFTRKMFRKLVGKRGDEFSELCDKTVKNVTKGILGVAFIQSLLLGILFMLAGVPFAAVWAVLVLILGIIQLPPTLISLPIIIYLYSAISPTMATVWGILIILASLSDNILKPILLGKGAPVPMLVIFLGAIGGFILQGFIGLFTGAIILSLGYELFMTWLNDTEDDGMEDLNAAVASSGD